MKLALIVPVLNRFDLFTHLIRSVDFPVRPYIIDNWNNNRGVAAAWNEGMLAAQQDGYQYAIISNDDAAFEPGAIERLYSNMIRTGAIFMSANPNGNVPRQGVIEGADFFCFMIDIPQLIKCCGLFDENFQPAYFEDNDMHYRIILSGKKTYMDTESIAIHHGSSTQYLDRNNPVVPPHQFENNRRYFAEKWGGVPGQEVCTTPYGSPNHTIRDWDRR